MGAAHPCGLRVRVGTGAGTGHIFMSRNSHQPATLLFVLQFTNILSILITKKGECFASAPRIVQVLGAGNRSIRRTPSDAARYGLSKLSSGVGGNP
jgi:hypothetical protein